MEKLQRQRALLHEHLRWLESEIAAEASAVPERTAPSAVPERVLHAESETRTATASASTEPAVDVPEPNVRGIHNEVRSGCLLYFGLASLAVGLVVAFIYWRY